jgi:hypothetical protein
MATEIVSLIIVDNSTMNLALFIGFFNSLFGKRQSTWTVVR